MQLTAAVQFVPIVADLRLKNLTILQLSYRKKPKRNIEFSIQIKIFSEA